jgi:hypothetical protein
MDGGDAALFRNFTEPLAVNITPFNGMASALKSFRFSNFGISAL